MNVAFTQVLLARANRNWEWPTGGTEHKPVFQPSWFHETKGSDSFSLEQGDEYKLQCLSCSKEDILHYLVH